jgi:hypothetical protein
MAGGDKRWIWVGCNLGLLLTAAACFQTREQSVLARKRPPGADDVAKAAGGAAARAGSSAGNEPDGVVAIPPEPVGGSKVRRERMTPAERGVCARGGYCEELASPQTTGFDLLFVVDNSSSMREEQAELRAQFPHLIRTMTGEEPNSRGDTFPPVRDLHLGIVSTDMGVVGVPSTWAGCNDPRHTAGGDDGVLQHAGSAELGCGSTYPPFLSFVQGHDDPDVIARDFGCIASLGTKGCGFEQPLEAALKALWPKNYIDESGNVLPASMNPIEFLSTTAEGLYGHGDTPPNAGFLRNDPVVGVSMLEVVVVTDEEDCSSANTAHLATTIDPADPQSSPPANLRCFYNKQNLYDVERYVNGLKKLRPGREDTVIFGAIVGVPRDLTKNTGETYLPWDAHYDRILNDPRMQERPMNEDHPELANLAPSCTRTDRNGERADAYPPRRIVEVAKGFGDRSWVASICQDDFSEAIDPVFPWTAEINSQCLPQPLRRNTKGLIDCDMIVELPAPGPFPQTVPTECTGPLLSPVSRPRTAQNVDGGVNCKLMQLAVHAGVPEAGDGFYYDDTIGDDNKALCMQNRGTSIRFTEHVDNLIGLRMYIDCAPGAEL